MPPSCGRWEPHRPRAFEDPNLGVYGWLSKLWSLLGPLNTKCCILIKEPKRDLKFDSHPYGCLDGWALFELLRVGCLGVCGSVSGLCMQTKCCTCGFFVVGFGPSVSVLLECRCVCRVQTAHDSLLARQENHHIPTWRANRIYQACAHLMWTAPTLSPPCMWLRFEARAPVTMLSAVST